MAQRSDRPVLPQGRPYGTMMSPGGRRSHMKRFTRLLTHVTPIDHFYHGMATWVASMKTKQLSADQMLTKIAEELKRK